MSTVSLSLYEYAILSTLIVNSGTIVVEGTKRKVEYVLQRVRSFKRRGLIDYTDVEVSRNKIHNLSFYKVRLKGFKYVKPTKIVERGLTMVLYV